MADSTDSMKRDAWAWNCGWHNSSSPHTCRNGKSCLTSGALSNIRRNTRLPTLLEFWLMIFQVDLRMFFCLWERQNISPFMCTGEGSWDEYTSAALEPMQPMIARGDEIKLEMWIYTACLNHTSLGAATIKGYPWEHHHMHVSSLLLSNGTHKACPVYLIPNIL